MTFNLNSRHFLKLDDFTPQEIGFLLQLSAELKAAKYARRETQLLKGKHIALIFEKDSTRTRSAFEVAAFDQGANVTYIGPNGSHIGSKETMKDTARVLGRMYDGIEYRGFSQAQVEELWGLDTTVAEALLSALVSATVLRRTPQGTYVCATVNDTSRQPYVLPNDEVRRTT